MDSTLMRPGTLAATYPSPRPARQSGARSRSRDDAAAGFREHAPVYVRHSDGELMWRKGRLLLREPTAKRCRCLVENTAGGAMVEEVTVPQQSVSARDMNQPDADVDDMAAGIEVDNDATIVNLLRARFEHQGDKRIYTACGGADILLAINPWEALDPASLERGVQHFDAAKAAAGWRAQRRDAPHVWGLVAAAIDGLAQSDGKRAQSICVCGVAGSGKSSASELALSYFAGALQWSGEGLGAEALTCARDALESFGCAGTAQNPRSSRFGRFVEVLLHVRPDGEARVLGAQVDAFMLERSRVHRRRAGPETNFLVFEQLRASASDLLPVRVNEDDASGARVEQFERLVTALGKLGLSSELRQSVFRVVAAVAEVSDLSFETTDGGSLSFDSSRAADLLGCPRETVHELLGSRRVSAANEAATVVDFTPKQAQRACHGLAKSLYSRLFAWLVHQINGSMAPQSDSELELELEPEPDRPGTLIVKVVRGYNLVGADNRGKSSDPYVKICLDDRIQEAQKTSRRNKTLDPVFNESLNFENFTKNCRSLTVAVFDFDRGAKDEFIGECVVDVQEMVRKASGGPWVETFAFGDCGGRMSKRERKQVEKRSKSGDLQPCGSVKLEFSYREGNHVASSAVGSSELMKELEGMKLRALSKRALSMGIAAESVEDAMDADDGKAALISLIVEVEFGGSGVVGLVNVLDLPGLDGMAAGGDGLGFDQLCANYVDERLHNQFLHFTVKKVQADYVKEGLKWQMISYPDNASVVTALEQVFSLLEFQHLRGKHGSDAHFLQTVHEHAKSERKGAAGKASNQKKATTPHGVNVIGIPRFGSGHFTVRHYSGEEIVYSAKGFREQNEDVAYADVIELALADCCEESFVEKLLADARPSSARQQHVASMDLLDVRHSPPKAGRNSLMNASSSQSSTGIFGISSIGSYMADSQNLSSGTSGLSWGNSEPDRLHPRVKSVSLSRCGFDRNVSPRQTLLSVHCGRIDMLCEVLAKSKLHYVRCLVPNLDQNPEVFSERVIHAQLQSQGVLQAIRVHRRGFPHCMTHRAVLNQYWLCVHDPLLAGSVMKADKAPGAVQAWKAVGQSEQREKAAVCTLLLACRAIGTQAYAVGRTKAFFTWETQAILDSSRARMMPVMYTRAQALVRGYLIRLRVRNLVIDSFRLAAAVRIQRWWLARSARRARLNMLQTVKKAGNLWAKEQAEAQARLDEESARIEAALAETARLKEEREAEREEAVAKAQRKAARAVKKQAKEEAAAEAEAAAMAEAAATVKRVALAAAARMAAMDDPFADPFAADPFAEEAAAEQPAAAAQPPDLAAAMTVGQLRRQAADLGVDPAQIEEARDGDDPASGLRALIQRAQANPPNPFGDGPTVAAAAKPPSPVARVVARNPPSPVARVVARSPSPLVTAAETTAAPETMLLTFYTQHAPAFAQPKRVTRIVASYRRRGQRIARMSAKQSDDIMYDELTKRHGTDPRASSSWQRKAQPETDDDEADPFADDDGPFMQPGTSGPAGGGGFGDDPFAKPNQPDTGGSGADEAPSGDSSGSGSDWASSHASDYYAPAKIMMPTSSSGSIIPTSLPSPYSVGREVVASPVLTNVTPSAAAGSVPWHRSPDSGSEDDGNLATLSLTPSLSGSASPPSLSSPWDQLAAGGDTSLAGDNLTSSHHAHVSKRTPTRRAPHQSRRAERVADALAAAPPLTGTTDWGSYSTATAKSSDVSPVTRYSPAKELAPDDETRTLDAMFTSWQARKTQLR